MNNEGNSEAAFITSRLTTIEWGPVITNEDDESQTRIIIADDEGNVTEFEKND